MMNRKIKTSMNFDIKYSEYIMIYKIFPVYMEFMTSSSIKARISYIASASLCYAADESLMLANYCSSVKVIHILFNIAKEPHWISTLGSESPKMLDFQNQIIC